MFDEPDSIVVPWLHRLASVGRTGSETGEQWYGQLVRNVLGIEPLLPAYGLFLQNMMRMGYARYVQDEHGLVQPRQIEITSSGRRWLESQPADEVSRT